MAKRTKKVGRVSRRASQTKACVCERGMRPERAFVILAVTAFVATFISLGFDAYMNAPIMYRTVEYMVRFLSFFVPGALLVVYAASRIEHLPHCAHRK